MSNNEPSTDHVEGTTAEQTAEFTALKDQIAKRSSQAKIEYEEVELWEDAPSLWLNLPAGRDKHTVIISTVEEAKALLSFPFEEYVFLGRYYAYCSYKQGFIEAGVTSLNQASHTYIFSRLFGPINNRSEEEWIQSASIELKREPEEAGQTITISPMSQQLLLLAQSSTPQPAQFTLSIKIQGLHITQHDQALHILEKISNTIFFELDVAQGLPLSLWRKRRGVPLRRRRTRRPPIAELHFPKIEYDNEPVSLYWYARSATGMPLLQFLAYYQAIEFFFPIYSQSEARRRIRNILKTPGFSYHRDADIVKLLSVVKLGVGRGFGDERSQLRATLQECLDANSVREFLTADRDRNDFFTSKSKAPSAHKLPLANPDADLRNDVADRIYDIRCKIVHTKTGANEGELELLLPFSKEADLLDYDIELIQYVAQQVLIASSRELNLYS